MSLTIDEQERAAYQAGNLALADALAALADAQAEIDTLRALVRDALDGEAGDDAWRERAQAAIED